MNVSLTPQLEEFIEKKLRRGRYNTASEVVREGLRLLEEQDVRRASERERLRREIKLGLDQIKRGEVGPLNMRKVKTEGRRRLSARRLKRVG